MYSLRKKDEHGRTVDQSLKKIQLRSIAHIVLSAESTHTRLAVRSHPSSIVSAMITTVTKDNGTPYQLTINRKEGGGGSVQDVENIIYTHPNHFHG